MARRRAIRKELLTLSKERARAFQLPGKTTTRKDLNACACSPTCCFGQSTSAKQVRRGAVNSLSHEPLSAYGSISFGLLILLAEDG